MTTLLNMLDRFEQAAVTYETSTKKADRDELHAARRAIMEAFEGRSASAEPVGCLTDVVAMSADIESKRVLKLHFNRDVTDADRARLVALHNAARSSPPTSKREAELVKALTRIAAPHGCGCHPCVGQCRSQEALEIEVDALRDIARAAIHPSLEQE